jgi:hypothetical protein
VSEEGPAELLEDMAALRRRARADRRGYWFPLVLFGVLTLGAAPLYVAPELPGPVYDAHGNLVPGPVYDFQPGTGWVGRYWLAALIVGGLLTVWWYRRRGRRIGPQSAGAVAVVSAALVVAAVAVLGFTPLAWVLWPLDRGYGATLVIAAGLIALARAERSPVLTGMAATYTAAALLGNLYNVENVLFDLGWDPFTAHPDQARFTPLPNLLLPGLVLLLAGTATGLAALARRRR